MKYSSETAVVILVASALALGSTPALAIAVTVPGEPSGDPFVAAQRSLGLSIENATSFTPGLKVENSNRSAQTTFGDFALTLSAQSVHSKVNPLMDGARIMTALEEGEKVARFSVELPAHATLQPSGSGFSIRVDAGDTKLDIGSVKAPWAVDSKGKRLPTSYTLAGDEITQHVDVRGASYPIIADPTITFGILGASDGPGAYWNMTGAQKKAIAAAAKIVAGFTVAGGCVAAAKIPKVGYIVQGLCTFLGVPGLKAIWNSVVKTMNSTSVESGACYQIKIAPVGKKFYKVASSNCS